MAVIWTISTNKGGILKTTLTTCLAGVMAQKGKKVLIIDTDNQGNAVLSFGVNPDKLDLTLYDVLIENLPPEKAIIKVHENIDILPCNDDMSFFEIDVLSNKEKYKNPFYLLRNAFIEFDFNRYDFVLIDTPPNLGLVQSNCLCFTDKVLIPFQPESYSMRSLVKTLQAINEFKYKHNPKLEILGIIPTLVNSRTNLHTEVLKQCREFATKHNVNVSNTLIPRSVRFASSVSYDRLPATLTDKNNSVVKNYFQLFEEVNGNGTEG